MDPILVDYSLMRSALLAIIARVQQEHDDRELAIFMTPTDDSAEQTAVDCQEIAEYTIGRLQAPHRVP